MLRNPDDHKKHPELWFRPSPRLPLKGLLALLEARVISATPRLGARDASHPKGYVPGQQVVLRVVDEQYQEHLERTVRIKNLSIRPINTLTQADLRHLGPYTSWQEVREDLSFFEGRTVAPHESATIVEFAL